MTEEEWKGRVSSQLEQIDKRLRALETSEAVDAAIRSGIDARLQAIEDTLKWLVRLVIGALLLALIAAITKGGLLTKAYQDTIGTWTICYGEARGVDPGDSYSKAQCDAMLAAQGNNLSARLAKLEGA